MTPEEIHEAFISTNFIILKNDIFIDSVTLKIGEIHILPANIRSWAYITASNPLPTILNYEENVSKNNNLLNDLTNRGYKFHLGKGVSADGEWEEDSFFIENINKATALELAIKYGQMAFVYGIINQKAELIYC
jgi:hypothetical protein